jgi:hypothetical protein
LELKALSLNSLRGSAAQASIMGVPRHRISLCLGHVAVRIPIVAFRDLRDNRRWLRRRSQAMVVSVPRHGIALRLRHVAIRILRVALRSRRDCDRLSRRDSMTVVVGIPNDRISLRFLHIAEGALSLRGQTLFHEMWNRERRDRQAAVAARSFFIFSFSP